MTVESTASRQVDRCCPHHGLYYTDGRYRCWRHASDQDRQLVIELDRRAGGRIRRIGGELQWPYGPYNYVEARRRMLEWAEAHDLSLSRVTSCLHWLRRGRCYRFTPYRDNPHPDTTDHYGGYADYAERWLDHVTGWVREGKPAVLVAQPYGLSEQSRSRLAGLDQEPDLRVEIRGDSWYGAGTTFVGVWRVYPDLRGKTQ